MTEFNLSEKIMGERTFFAKVIKIEDVKEFIRLLKEEGFKKWKEEKIDFPIGNYFDFIDKLAGDKLNGEQKQLKVLKKGRTELAKKRLKDKREAYLRAKRALNRLRNRN